MFWNRRIFTVIVFALFSGPIYSQLPDIPVPKFEYDSNYVVKFDNLLALRLVSPRRVYNFRLRNPDTRESLNYRPNLHTAVGLGITYRWLAFDMVFTPKWDKRKIEKFGETKEFNVKATLYLKRDMIEIGYRRYKGLHITNPGDYLNPWDGKFPYRPDIINQNLQIDYSIPFNGRKYSLRTTLLVDGRLKKSSGSGMYTACINYQSMKADSSIVPIEYADNFDEFAQINRYGFVMIQQSIGYAYTFIYRKFYLTLSALPGFSYTFGNVNSEGGEYKANSFNFMLLSRNGIGYNSRKWYAGMYFIYKNQSVRFRDNLSFNNNIGEFRFFVGYRIHAPYVLKSVLPE